MAEETNRKVGCKSIIKSLFNLQLGIDADQATFSYHKTLYSLVKLKPTRGLQNDSTVGNSQISEIHFNSKGNLLANSYWVEDRIQIWDWYEGTLKKVVSTGHDFTVMHFNWVPCGDDNLLVTSGQQGDVRLTDITTNDSRLLLETYTDDSTNFCMPRGYRFSVNKNLPHTILAGGQTGKIVYIDVREESPTDLFTIKYDGPKCYEIHSLDINPVKCSEFCVGGINNVRIYDHRNSSEPVQEFNLIESNADGSNSPSVQEERYIDAIEYNFNGTELLATSSSDPIYLFDTLKQKAAKKFSILSSFRQSYNIYDAHFCGQKCEFLITISSISEEFPYRAHTVYIWDKETQELLREITLTEDSWRFAVHPTLPVLAMNWNHEGIRLWQ